MQSFSLSKFCYLVRLIDEGNVQNITILETQHSQFLFCCHSYSICFPFNVWECIVSLLLLQRIAIHAVIRAQYELANMQCQIYDHVFMHGPRCTVQVQVTNILLDRVVIFFHCPGPTQLVSLKNFVVLATYLCWHLKHNG